MAEDETFPVKSGFVGHFLLEEFVGDKLSSSDNVLSHFTNLVNKLLAEGYGQLYAIKQELLLGSSLENIIYTFSKKLIPKAIDGETDQKAEDLIQAEFKKTFQDFWSDNNLDNRGIHFQGGYYEEKKGGHAVGWYLSPDGIYFTNSGEGLNYHKSELLTYKEIIVYHRWRDFSKEYKLNVFVDLCLAVVKCHRESIFGNIDSVYSQQVPVFMKEFDEFKLRDGDPIEINDIKGKSMYSLIDLEKNDAFDTDPIAVRSRFFIKNGRFWAFPQLTGSCAFFCTAWYVQLRIAQLLGSDQIDELWERAKHIVLGNLEPPLILNNQKSMKESSLLISIYQTLVQRYKHVKDHKWVKLQREIMNYLLKYPLFYEVEKPETPFELNFEIELGIKSENKPYQSHLSHCKTSLVKFKSTIEDKNFTVLNHVALRNLFANVHHACYHLNRAIKEYENFVEGINQELFYLSSWIYLCGETVRDLHKFLIESNNWNQTNVQSIYGKEAAIENYRDCIHLQARINLSLQDIQANHFTRREYEDVKNQLKIQGTFFRVENRGFSFLLNHWEIQDLLFIGLDNGLLLNHLNSLVYAEHKNAAHLASIPSRQPEYELSKVNWEDYVFYICGYRAPYQRMFNYDAEQMFKRFSLFFYCNVGPFSDLSRERFIEKLEKKCAPLEIALKRDTPFDVLLDQWKIWKFTIEKDRAVKAHEVKGIEDLPNESLNETVFGDIAALYFTVTSELGFHQKRAQQPIRFEIFIRPNFGSNTIYRDNQMESMRRDLFIAKMKSSARTINQNGSLCYGSLQSIKESFDQGKILERLIPEDAYHLVNQILFESVYSMTSSGTREISARVDPNVNTLEFIRWNHNHVFGAEIKNMRSFHDLIFNNRLSLEQTHGLSLVIIYLLSFQLFEYSLLDQVWQNKLLKHAERVLIERKQQQQTNDSERRVSNWLSIIARTAIYVFRDGEMRLPDDIIEFFKGSMFSCFGRDEWQIWIQNFRLDLIETITFKWSAQEQEKVKLKTLFLIESNSQWNLVIGALIRRVIWSYWKKHPDQIEVQYFVIQSNMPLSKKTFQIFTYNQLNRLNWFTTERKTNDFTWKHFDKEKQHVLTLRSLGEKQNALKGEKRYNVEIRNVRDKTIYVSKAKGILGSMLDELKQLNLPYQALYFEEKKKVELQLLKGNGTVWATLLFPMEIKINLSFLTNVKVNVNGQSYWLTYKAPIQFRNWARFNSRLFSLLLYQRGTFYLMQFEERYQTGRKSDQLWSYGISVSNLIIPETNHVIPIHYSGIYLTGTLQEHLHLLLISIVHHHSWIVDRLAPTLISYLHEDQNTNWNRVIENSIISLFQEGWFGTPYRFWLMILFETIQKRKTPTLDVKNLDDSVNKRKYAYPKELTDLFLKHPSDILIIKDIKLEKLSTQPWVQTTFLLLQKWYSKKSREVKFSVSNNVKEWMKSDETCEATEATVTSISKDLVDLKKKLFEWIDNHDLQKWYIDQFLFQTIGTYNMFFYQDQNAYQRIHFQMDLLQHHLILKSISSLEDYIEQVSNGGVGNKVVPCELLIRFFASVDPSTIDYKQKRTQNVASFVAVQWMGGFLTRKTQDQIANDILNEYNSIEHIPSIRQAVMGIGKSSVIIPLILFHMLAEVKVPNVFLLQPTHLVNPATKRYEQVISPLVNWFSMNTNTTVQRGTMETHYNKYFKEMTPERRPFVWITSDSSIKSFYLQLRMDSKQWDHVSHRSYAIMDEIDSMYNPNKSDLNFPVGEPFPHFFADWIETKCTLELKDKKTNTYKLVKRETDQLIRADCFLKSGDVIMNEDHKKFRILTITSHNEQIQSVQLDKIYTSQSPFFIQEIPFITFYYHLIFNLVSESHKKKRSLSEKEVMDEMIATSQHLHLNLLFGDSRYLHLRDKLVRTIALGVSLIKNLNYGFRPDLPYAVPYIAEKRPSQTSFFEDIDLSCVLTAFLYQEFIETGLTNEQKRLYQLASDSYSDYLKKEEKKDIRTLTVKDYLLDFVFPLYMKSFKANNNVSFIDIMEQGFSKYRTAFSGTISMNVPVYISENREERKDWNPNLARDQITEGSIEAAIIGFPNNREDVITLFQPNIYNNIIQYMIDNHFTALLDCAAIFKDLPFLDGVPTFVQLWFQASKNSGTGKLKGIVYINLENTAYIYSTENPKLPITSVDLLSSIPGEYYYYYSQAHTIGTDLPQPVQLKGLALVGRHVTKSAVAQGIYRLRLIHHGHTIHFGSIEPIIMENPNMTREQYWYFLNEQEKEENVRQFEKHLIQNLLVINKQEKKYNPYSYEIPSFYSALHVNKGIFFNHLFSGPSQFKSKTGKDLLEQLTRTIKNNAPSMAQSDDEIQVNEQQNQNIQQNQNQNQTQVQLQIKKCIVPAPKDVNLVNFKDYNKFSEIKQNTGFLSGLSEFGIYFSVGVKNILMRNRKYDSDGTSLYARYDSLLRKKGEEKRINPYWNYFYILQIDKNLKLITPDEYNVITLDSQDITQAWSENTKMWLTITDKIGWQLDETKNDKKENEETLLNRLILRFLSHALLTFEEELQLISLFVKTVPEGEQQQRLILFIQSALTCFHLTMRTQAPRLFHMFLNEYPKDSKLTFFKLIFTSPETFFLTYTWFTNPTKAQIEIAQELVRKWLPEQSQIVETQLEEKEIVYPKQWFEFDEKKKLNTSNMQEVKEVKAPVEPPPAQIIIQHERKVNLSDWEEKKIQNENPDWPVITTVVEEKKIEENIVNPPPVAEIKIVEPIDETLEKNPSFFLFSTDSKDEKRYEMIVETVTQQQKVDFHRFIALKTEHDSVPPLLAFTTENKVPFNEDGLKEDQLAAEYSIQLPYCRDCKEEMNNFYQKRLVRQTLVCIFGHWMSNRKFNVQYLPENINKEIINREPDLLDFISICLILEKEYKQYYDHLSETEKYNIVDHKKCQEMILRSDWFKSKREVIKDFKIEEKDLTLVDWKTIVPMQRWIYWIQLLNQPGREIKDTRTAFYYKIPTSDILSALPPGSQNQALRGQKVDALFLNTIGSHLNHAKFDLLHNIVFVPSYLVDQHQENVNTRLKDWLVSLQSVTRILTVCVSNDDQFEAFLLIEYFTAKRKGQRMSIRVTTVTIHDEVETKERALVLIPYLSISKREYKTIYKNITYETIKLPKKTNSTVLPYYLLLLATHWNISTSDKIKQFLHSLQRINDKMFIQSVWKELVIK